MEIKNIRVLKTFDMCNDAMFKSVFRSIEARRVVIDFLSAITGISEEKMAKASFDSGEIVKSNLNEKGKTSDVLVKLNDEEKIIVEMNGYWNDYLFNKNTEYAFSIIVESTKSNKKYSKVILINIDNMNRFKTNKPILYFKLRDEDGNIENESYNSIHLVLENAVNIEYNKNIDKRIVKYAEFLKMTNIDEMLNAYKGDDTYMAAIRRVEDLSTDPDFIGYYDVEEAHKQDLEDSKQTGIRIGKEFGIAEGKNIATIAIVKEMLASGISSEEISMYTKLDISEIEKLKDM